MSEDRIEENNTREEVYSGTYILDGLPISIEEQRNKIFEMMEKDGVSVQNPEELEIVYEGADNDYGESETLATKFIVYRKHMTPTKKQEQDETLKELEMLKALRKQLEDADDSHDREQIMEKITAISEGKVIPEETAISEGEVIPEEEIIPEETGIPEEEAIPEETAIVEEDSAVADEVVNPIDNELGDKDSLLKDIEMLNHKYDVGTERMGQIVEEEQAELNGDSLLSDEEITAIKLGSLNRKEDVLAELNSIINEINDKRTVLSTKESETLGQGIASDTVISEDEEIVPKVIVPDEERVVIQEDVVSEEEEIIKEDDTKYPLAIIQRLHLTEGFTPKIEISRPLRVPETSLVVVKKDIETLPAKIVGTSVAPDYTPDKGPADMEEVQVGAPEKTISVEVYHDKDNDDIYLLKDTFDRFHIIPISEEKEIGGKKCYQADRADVEEILSKVESDDHIQVSHETVQLGKKPSLLPEDDFDVVKKDSGDLVEKIVLYQDKEHDDVVYIRKHLFQRFSIDMPVGPEVLINGAVCYEISEKDANAIMKNADNDYSPYRVEVRDVQIDKKEEPVVEIPVVDSDEEEILPDESLRSEEPVVEIPVVDSDEKEIIPDESLRSEEPVVEIPVVDSDDEEILPDESLRSEEPVVEIPVVDSDEEEILPDDPYSEGLGHEEEFEDVYASVDEIVDKLSDGLDLERNIQEGTVKTFQNGRVNCTKLFFDELKNDAWEYNIVGALPAIITASAAFLKKISANITLSLDSRDRLEEVVSRLQDLSESELETLFAEYHNYSSNEGKKSIIDPLIVDFIRGYQYDKIEGYFASIKECYQMVGSCMSLIHELEQKKLVDKENESLYEESITEYYKLAADAVVKIKELRQEASYYLDNDSYGLSKHYLSEGKALVRDLSGFRLNEEALAEVVALEQKLSDSLENHDDRAVVDSFVELEAFFGKHGKRISMGSLPLKKEETIVPESSNLSDEKLETMIRDALDEMVDDHFKTI